MRICRKMMKDFTTGKLKLNTRSKKKQARKLLTFVEEQKCSPSEEPTCHLFVGNGGVLCGIGREQLFSAFNKFGDLSNIRLFPGKPYSLVSFKNLDSCKKAFGQLHGTSIEDSMSFQVTLNPSKQYGISKLNLAYLTQPPKDLNATDPSRDLPNGLALVTDFVSEEEEVLLLKMFGNNSADVSALGSSMKHRSVSHYGYEFLYGSNNIDKSKPLDEKIPAICESILQKLIKKELIDFLPDQLTVNRYLPGQGIPPHVDTHSAFEDGIVSLSLGSQTVMDFTDLCNTANTDIRSIVLPRRSVLIMKGPSRYSWSHGITPRKFDIVDGEIIDGLPNGLTLSKRETRISLTFRKIRRTPCDCKFPEHCDSQKDSLVENLVTQSENAMYVPTSSTEAQSLEDTHVTQVYDEIAEHFSGTRHSAWPKIAHFVNSLPAGSFMGDVGCGNGKYLGVNDSIAAFGSDRSENLASICKERGFSVIVADIMSLPYRSCCFDAVICIAVIHHMSTSERRLAAIKELTKTVCIGGKILISVWAMEQEESSATGKPCESIEKGLSVDSQSKMEASEGKMRLADISLEDGESSELTGNDRKRLEVSAGRNQFQQQDLLVPWHFKKPGTSSKNITKQKENNAKTLHRFYHLFKKGELISLCSKLNNVKVIDEYYDRGNWCAILEKIGHS